METYEIRHTVAGVTMTLAARFHTASPDTAERELAHHSDVNPGIFRLYKNGEYVASAYNGCVAKGGDESRLWAPEVSA